MKLVEGQLIHRRYRLDKLVSSRRHGRSMARSGYGN